jgi:hypothetical protein
MDAAGPAARAGFEGDTFRGGSKIMRSMRDTARPAQPVKTMAIGRPSNTAVGGDTATHGGGVVKPDVKVNTKSGEGVWSV